jgi:hypothetical protein
VELTLKTSLEIYNLDFSDNPIAEKSDYRAKLFEMFKNLAVRILPRTAFSLCSLLIKYSLSMGWTRMENPRTRREALRTLMKRERRSLMRSSSPLLKRAGTD